jgi:uncharacterized integral membrane protein
MVESNLQTPSLEPDTVEKPSARHRIWPSVITLLIVLLGLLIFIFQNTNKVRVAFLGFHGLLPLGATLLFAALLGGILVAVAGTVRIVQLRRDQKVNSKLKRPVE